MGKKENSSFKSSLMLPSEEVVEVLKRKIDEENQLVRENTTKETLAEEKRMFANAKYVNDKINVVSLFSGAGGLDLGMMMAGISAKFSPKIAYSVFNDEVNFKEHSKIVHLLYSNDLFDSSNKTYSNNFEGNYIKDSRDIRKVSSFPKCDLMLGGFPCPGFSAAGPRLLDDPRNFLYVHYIRALMDSKPKVFVAENVKGLMTMAKGKVLEQMTEDFSAAGYQISVKLVNARDYGVPQNRERVFIVGVRNDLSESGAFNYTFPQPTNGHNLLPFVTLKDAIGDLPKNPEDVFDSSYSSIYMSRNRKKAWDDQSFTIQASGRQAPQYPGGQPMEKIDKDKWKFSGKFNRRLSVSECARIQTFPDWFSFSDGGKISVSRNHRLNEQYKQIGNAVPVILSEKILRPIMSFLISELR